MYWRRISRREELFDVRQGPCWAREDRWRYRHLRGGFRQNQRQATRQALWHQELPRPHVLPGEGTDHLRRYVPIMSAEELRLLGSITNIISVMISKRFNFLISDFYTPSEWSYYISLYTFGFVLNKMFWESGTVHSVKAFFLFTEQIFRPFRISSFLILSNLVRPL